MPARLSDYQYGELDGLCETGALTWQGLERLSPADGVLAVYRPERVALLARIGGLLPGALHARLRDLLADGPRSFAEITTRLGGFPPQLLEALWDMVWAGEVSNQRLLPLLALAGGRGGARRGAGFRRPRGAGGARYQAPAGSAGQWYALGGRAAGFASPRDRDCARAGQLLDRWGIVGSRSFTVDGAGGGFARFERALDEKARDGSVVRGVFVQGLGAVQFALPRALRLGACGAGPRTWVLAASDPANPYGGLLPWPKSAGPARRPQRAAGARVVLREGELIGYLGARGDLLTFTPPGGRGREVEHDLIAALKGYTPAGRTGYLRSVDGQAPERSPLGRVVHGSRSPSGRRGDRRRR